MKRSKNIEQRAGIFSWLLFIEKMFCTFIRFHSGHLLNAQRDTKEVIKVSLMAKQWN